ncbi:MAG TPA: MBL fold metallo-hydrolase [Chloroflexota bacterium]|nr:MBL fold metallo-hydrolase [Chloroflexota bacterium]
MIRLLGELWLVGGQLLTHPWDASSYLIKGDEPTFIDFGSTEGYPAIKRSLGAFGYQPSDIKRVLATHGHWDHLSGVASLRAESDTELWIHEADRAQVECGDFDMTSAFLYDRPFPPLRVDGTLQHGQIIEVGDVQLHVIHTPGHTAGSVCFWTEMHGMRLLIAGDTISGGYHPRIGSDLAAWTRSLDRLLELEFDVMTIGHYPPRLIFDARHRVAQLRERFAAYFDPWFVLADAG